MINVSANIRSAAQREVKSPNVVLVLEGIDQRFGSATILKLIRVGDPGLVIDGSWKIGGARPLEGQAPFVSLGGSSTSIRQQLDADKGRGSSIQSLDIELIDVRGEITELITPGVVVDDILGRKAKIYLALDFETATFPEDYMLLFRGIISDIKAQPASIILTVASPEQKKKQILFPKVEFALAGALNNSATTIPLTGVDGFLLPVAGPDGVIDNSFLPYVRIDDEIISYSGIVGNSLTGCVRARFDTLAAAHDDESDVESWYRVKGNAIDLALKLMLSTGDYWLSDQKITSINLFPYGGGLTSILYFDNIDVETEFGVSIGDFVTVENSVNSGNNVTLEAITAIGKTPEGSYIEVASAMFSDELPTAATVSFRSRYDTLPNGLGMGADEVDVAQHESLKQKYLTSFLYDFYLKDQIEDMREWLDKEIYKPMGAYSVPRKGQASMQLLLGPIPGSRIPTLDKSNIVSPSKLRIRRSIGKNFYNTVVYKYEEDTLEDKFRKGAVFRSEDSVNRIPVGTSALLIESRGLRVTDLGQSLAEAAAQRRLDRYKFGAEYIEGMIVTFGIGFDIELGDLVIFDPTDLNVVNTALGNRQKPAAFFEVVNKSLNYKTGEVVLDLLDTTFDENARYGLIGISSQIKNGVDSRHFVIEQKFASTYGTSEFLKWSRYTRPRVRVCSPDYTTRNAFTRIRRANSNTIEVENDLGFVPQPGDILTLAPYAQATAEIRLIYAHMSILSDFSDPYKQL